MTKNKLNLLYVITKLELGGAQTQLLSMIRGLKDDFNIFLFTAQEGLLLKEAFLIEGLRIKRSRFLERPINPLKDLLAILELYYYIKKNRIQVVHTHSSKAGILGRWAAALAGIKNILHTVHGWSFNDFQPFLLKGFYVFLERINAVFTRKLIVVSYFDKCKGLNNRIGRENKYELIRYGIDFENFRLRDADIRKELKISSDERAVGMVSCFKPQKAPLDFVRAAFLVKQTLPETKFILVGDGILRPRIEILAKELGLENDLILTGWRRDIPRILSALDVFVLTSLWEGLPISVLEAIAASLPVIATNTGGICEIISNGKTGFLVDCSDITTIKKRIVALLNNQDLRKETGETARRSLDQSFTTGKMIENTRNLYNSLCHLQF